MFKISTKVYYIYSVGVYSTLSWRSSRAGASINSCTTARWPFHEARMRAVSPSWMWWNKGHSECYSTRYTVGPVTSVLELMLMEVVRSLRTLCTSPLSAASCNSVLSPYNDRVNHAATDSICYHGTSGYLHMEYEVRSMRYKACSRDMNME